MSSASDTPTITVVNSAVTLSTLLSKIATLPISPPSLYIDLEGVNLGRNGSLSIVSLYVLPIHTVYLIDVYCLGEAAFTTTNGHNSLKAILESATVPKVIFDIRNDSDALYNLYGVSVDGIRDLQLMELATRRGSKNLVAGLATCIRRDSNMSSEMKAEWQRIKDIGVRLFNPQYGGSYAVFNERPLKPEILQYCAQDVSLLPLLFRLYDSRLQKGGQAFWRAEVKKAIKDRIKLSTSPTYDGQARSKINGPWSEWYIENATDQWNEEVMFCARHGEKFNFNCD